MSLPALQGERHHSERESVVKGLQNGKKRCYRAAVCAGGFEGANSLAGGMFVRSKLIELCP